MEPTKLYTMVLYVIIDGVLTVKEYVLNPNA
jgi:hypothetical protein